MDHRCGISSVAGMICDINGISSIAHLQWNADPGSALIEMVLVHAAVLGDLDNTLNLSRQLVDFYQCDTVWRAADIECN